MKKLFLIPFVAMGLMLGSCSSDNDEPQLPKEEEEEAVVLTQEMLKGYLEGNLFMLQKAAPLHYAGGGKWEEIGLALPGIVTEVDVMEVYPHGMIWSRDGKVYVSYLYSYGHFLSLLGYDGFARFNDYCMQHDGFGYPFFIVAEDLSYDAETQRLSTSNKALDKEEDEKLRYIVESVDGDNLTIRVEYGRRGYQGHEGARFTYVKTDEVPEQHRDFNSRDEFKEWFDKLIEDWKEADSSTL